ncbi:mobilization protein [Actinacidiphila sp. DG2A-62]|uniref:relaxase/mobilization nuclease domain-containing protein n=1 Tax=Actinacidiphila sp. DG2A-62 TaxID=3108821 RepID=UPI002DBAA3D9|nr:mobilization protein [Actinacidiphila sp. DG2A-62]MEC3995269.1 mobilization protein [Actinacidiphila sp. DG2A-62]
MIAKITRGKQMRRLLAYLYDTHKAKDHTDPHLVASWDGFAPDPGRDPNSQTAMTQLTNALELRLYQARGKDQQVPDKPVWQCSVRAAPEDPFLTDAQWADIARRVVAATGIAPDGDSDGCRWVAVRHADDHIHIAATTIRGDLRTARHWNDYLRADKELEAVERDYHLRIVIRGDRTAAQRPTRAETEKAHRTGHHHTPREQLRATLRTVVAVSTTTEEFFHHLTRSGILVEVLRFPSGDIRGYKVALEGDTNAAGEPVWFSGSTLAPDLSYPQIHARLTTTPPQPAPVAGAPRPNPWHQATAAIERIPHHLEHATDTAAQAHITAFAEALDALPLVTPKAIRAQLHEAAAAFERASRSRIKADHRHAQALRGAVRAIARQPPTTDGAALATFLDAAILALIAIQRWQSARHHNQQVQAARRTLTHLQAAYDHTAPAPLATLNQRQPPRTVMHHQATQMRQAVPGYAEHILTDPAWPALATVLTDAEAAGHDPARLLQQAADQRALGDARSPAQVLTWRIHRLTQRPAPSPRAKAAQSRSTVIGRSTLPSRHEEGGAASSVRAGQPDNRPRRR